MQEILTFGLYSLLKHELKSLGSKRNNSLIWWVVFEKLLVAKTSTRYKINASMEELRSSEAAFALLNQQSWVRISTLSTFWHELSSKGRGGSSIGSVSDIGSIACGFEPPLLVEIFTLFLPLIRSLSLNAVALSLKRSLEGPCNTADSPNKKMDA